MSVRCLLCSGPAEGNGRLAGANAVTVMKWKTCACRCAGVFGNVPKVQHLLCAALACECAGLCPGEVVTVNTARGLGKLEA